MISEDDGIGSVFTDVTRLTLWTMVDSTTSHKSGLSKSSNSDDDDKKGKG